MQGLLKSMAAVLLAVMGIFCICACRLAKEADEKMNRLWKKEQRKEKKS